MSGFFLWNTDKHKRQTNGSLQSVELQLNDYMGKRDSQGYRVYPGTEPEEYDFTAERRLMYGTNLLESTAHLVKGCIGAGVLSIHVGYMYAGIWTGLAATVFMGILLSYTMMKLISAAQKLYVRLRVPKLSYPDLAEAAVATGPFVRLRRFAKAFRYLVDVCLFAEMCGSCCIYEIMIAKTIKQFLEAISPVIRDADLSLRYFILLAAGPLIMLSLIRNLKYLAPFSIVADIAIVICVVVTTYYSLVGSGKISDRPAWKSFEGLVNFCGVCLYSMDGFSVILPIENNMRKPKYIFTVLQYGMTIVVVLLICTGLFGYWGWGELCKSPIIIHLPAKIVPLILQFLIIIMLKVTFAVHFWVPFRVMWYYISQRHYRNRCFWERFYRALLVLIITGISVAFPRLIRMMIFMGNFFLALTAFIFPAIIDGLVTWKDHHKGTLRLAVARNVFIISLGVFFCCGAFYSVIDV